jgi:hypothetical protein
LVDYAKDYSIERKETYKNILDLPATIELFKNAETPQEKQAIMQRFVEINNMLEKFGIVAP